MNTDWYKSSYSSGNGNCVEVARPSAAVLVRDTKDRDGGTLAFSGEAWNAFLAGVRLGEFAHE